MQSSSTRVAWSDRLLAVGEVETPRHEIVDLDDAAREHRERLRPCVRVAEHPGGADLTLLQRRQGQFDGVAAHPDEHGASASRQGPHPGERD